MNASAAELDLLNNSFGSDRGSNGGQIPISKQTRYHNAPPRHAPKQPPPPAPTVSGGKQLVQPPYIPPPLPRIPSSGNDLRKMSNEQMMPSRSGTGGHFSHLHQETTTAINAEESADGLSQNHE